MYYAIANDESAPTKNEGVRDMTRAEHQARVLTSKRIYGSRYRGSIFILEKKN